jgi:hypothetical protein
LLQWNSFHLSQDIWTFLTQLLKWISNICLCEEYLVMWIRNHKPLKLMVLKLNAEKSYFL